MTPYFTLEFLVQNQKQISTLTSPPSKREKVLAWIGTLCSFHTVYNYVLLSYVPMFESIQIFTPL
jgi:hypothetical protein